MVCGVLVRALGLAVTYAGDCIVLFWSLLVQPWVQLGLQRRFLGVLSRVQIYVGEYGVRPRVILYPLDRAVLDLCCIDASSPPGDAACAAATRRLSKSDNEAVPFLDHTQS